MYPEELSFDSDVSEPSRRLYPGEYSTISMIGEGSFGRVYLVRDHQNKHFALKEIQLPSDEEGLSTAVLRETSILFQFRHPNIVKLLQWSHCFQSKLASRRTSLTF